MEDQNDQNDDVALNVKNCAVCRFQKKKCEVTCKFAPYFPPDCNNEYQHAHWLFSTSNIVKMMGLLKTPKMKKVMADSILTEGSAWADDPVRGAFGIIRTLLWQIRFYEDQLERVNKQLRDMKDKGKRIMEPTDPYQSRNYSLQPPFRVPMEWDDEKVLEEIKMLDLKLFDEKWLDYPMMENRGVEGAPRGDNPNGGDGKE